MHNSLPHGFIIQRRLFPGVFILFILLFGRFQQSGLHADPVNNVQPFPSFNWVEISWDDDVIDLYFNNVEPGSYQLYDMDAPSRFVFDLPGRICTQGNEVYEAFNIPGISLVNELRASCSQDGVRIVLESRYPLYWQVISEPTDPFVHVQCLVRFRQTLEEMRIDDGTTYYARRYVTPSGQRLAHIVISDSSVSRLRPRIVMASDVSNRNLSSLADMVTGSRAAIGINGGYYSWPGVSLSLVVRYGGILAPPQLHRPALMILDNDHYIMGYPPVKGTATSSSGLDWAADVVNQVPGYGQVAILTPGHPSRLRDNLTTNFAVIRDGIVEAVNPAEFEDYTDCYIIWSKRYTASLNFLSIGEAVDIQLYVDASQNHVMHALQGGPFLVQNGEIDITCDEDDIGNDIAIGRSARSAVGIDDDNRIYLVAIEGNYRSRSIGSTLEELAWTMVDLGCTWAINLDGGSSTGMAMTYDSPDTDLPVPNRQLATALVLIDESGRMQGEEFHF
jgi:hypothetical protein